MKIIRAIKLLAFAFILPYTLFSQNHLDCELAAMPCGESPFSFPGSTDFGVEELIEFESCLIEFNSTWIKFSVSEAGELGFILKPETADQDLDFMLFKLDALDDCGSKQAIRCMASGENSGQPMEEWEACTGWTGLNEWETDAVEHPGCIGNDNNFLANVDVQVGDAFALCVNDFSATDVGFTIEFGGTAELDCIISSNENNQVESGEIKVYSSQTSSYVQLELPDKLVGGQLNILDSQGRLVSHVGKVYSKQELDLSHLVSGYYLFNVQHGLVHGVEQFVFIK